MAAITFDEKGDGKGADFGRVLKSRVADYFKTNKISQKADWRSWSKAVFFLGSAIAIYFTLVFGNVSSGTAVLLSIAAGLTLAGFGFNVMHDAIHRNFTAKSKLSKALYYSMDLFGASGNFYRIKHTIMHHTYTNVPGEDPDIEESPIIRMSPLQKHHGYHRYQIIYSTALYFFLAFDWIWRGDYDRMARLKVCSLQMTKPTAKEQGLFYFFKAFHAFYALAVPLAFHPVKSLLACYVVALATAGLVLSIVFQIAHIHEGASYPGPDESRQIKGGWARHQVITTANFATANPFVCWYLGGLSFQIGHNLFPNINHVHYPKLNPIVVATCKEFGVNYREFSSVSSAIFSHYRQLYLLGSGKTEAELSGESAVSQTVA